jgi:hypothetical protein
MRIVFAYPETARESAEIISFLKGTAFRPYIPTLNKSGFSR